MPHRKVPAELAVWVALVATLVLFGASSFTTYVSTAGLRSVLDEVRRTREMETVTALLLSAFRESQAERRAYLLSGDAYGREQFDSELAAWSDWETLEVSAGKRLSSGAVTGGFLRSRRFDRTDPGGFVDLYRTLWRGAYANVRVQLSPDAAVSARGDFSAELFQGFGGGWEGSASYRHMDFATNEVDIAAVSLGRFVGRWFARGRVTGAWATSDDGTLSYSALVRRYLGDSADQLVEVGAGAGGEALTTAASLVEVRHTSFVSAAAQRFLTPHLGLALTASVVSFEGIPRRMGGSVALLGRW